MAESSDVAIGQQATAVQYNNLRKDVLDPSLGHDHTGEVGHGKIVRPVATGNYTGNASDNRQITVGFKCSLVIVVADGAGDLSQAHVWFAIPNLSLEIDEGASPLQLPTTDLTLHATDGFEVDEDLANETGATYYYWAISE